MPVPASRNSSKVEEEASSTMYSVFCYDTPYKDKRIMTIYTYKNMLLNLLYFLSPNALEDRKKKRRY